MGIAFSSLFVTRHRSEDEQYRRRRKVILVTGASAGIGKAAALALLQRGHIVYGAARRVDCMQDLVAAGGYAIRLDVTQQAQVEAAVKRILTEQERIDVLVNNAGLAAPGPVEHVSMPDVRRVFDINFFGMVHLTTLVLPYMRQAQSGAIVNISSVAGRFYVPFSAVLHGHKACHGRLDR